MLSLSLKQKVLWLATGIVLSTAVLMMAVHRDHERTQDTATDHVHGNSDRNERMHMVYEIFALETTGRKVVLKYGITSQHDFITKDGNPRPEYQLPFYQLKYKPMKVTYNVLRRNIPSRIRAKQIEKELVKQHFERNQFMPLEQKLPKPW